MNNSFSLENNSKQTKVALITGSSRGIGSACALEFAKNGYNVVINSSKSIETLNHLKDEIESYGVSCLALLCDVSDYSSVCDMISKTINTFGRIDVLINNAGIAHIGMLQDMTFDEWNRIISTNLNSVYSCCHEVIPHMLSIGGGSILNVSSVWGICGASCEVAYSASKGGINSFTKALGKELAASNISVNAVALGAIDTDMNKCFSDEDINALVEEIPANRLGKPSEIANYIFTLATSSSKYLTGQVIQIDGGWI